MLRPHLYTICVRCIKLHATNLIILNFANAYIAYGQAFINCGATKGILLFEIVLFTVNKYNAPLRRKVTRFSDEALASKITNFLVRKLEKMVKSTLPNNSNMKNLSH